MSFNLYPNGGGGLTGDQLAVNKPLILGGTGHVWYVSSLLGTDAASPRGREREAPLKTLNQAFTNAATGDVVILMENHAEAISSTILVNKMLAVVSEGSGSTRAKLTAACGGLPMLQLTTTGTSLNNIYFPASTATPTARVWATANGIVCDNCYFECGALDLSATYLFGAVSSCQLTNAYFLATAAQPGIAVSAPSAATGLFLENVTLDGGAYGFSSAAFTAAGVLGSLYANKIHQLNNADVSLANGWTGVWIPGDLSGSARFEG